MTPLAYRRTGTGPPLVLLHALGSSRDSWDPVVPALAGHFDVLAVDLPGFGESPPLPAELEPSPGALASAVAGFLDELGIDQPAVVGNSVGGWVALELAALRPVASLTLLSPAGLWPGRTPLYCRVSLTASHWVSRHARGLLTRAVDFRLGRVLVLGQTHGRPIRMGPERARAAISALADGAGFDAALAATLPRHAVAPPGLDVPVTVAFGTRDLLLLPWQSRHVELLPPGTKVGSLRGCGHLPVSDDPAAVTALILSSAGAPVRRRMEAEHPTRRR
jgi:pimeloyl-ACP methyl ester carboxylesterase